MRVLAAIIVLLVLSPAAPAQQLPASVEGYEVLARGVFDGPGFALPPESQVTNITPRINADGSVVFAYFDSNIDKRIWVDGVTLATPAFFLSSDPSINADGNAVWRVSTLDPDPANWGVWLYDASAGAAARLTTAPLGASGWGSPRINDAGSIAYRAEFAINDALGVFESGVFTPLAVDDGTPYTFFTSGIGYNNAGQISARVFSTAGNGVAVFEADGSSALRIEDGSTSPTGDTFTGFLNGTAINDAGRVAINAFVAGSGQIIGVDPDGSVTVYADEDQPEIGELLAFNPVINDQGWIAFRAENASGQPAVFVADGTGLLEVASAGTVLDSDAGEAVITGFSGGLDINAAGQVLFNAALDTPGGASLGRAIVRADLAVDDPCPADVNMDGSLDAGDFFAWVVAFTNQAPACDQNNDSACDAGDFFAWVAAFGAGCD